MSRKDDKGKLRFSLLPWGSVREVVKIFEHGAEKYGSDNWKTVQDPENRYLNALMRHTVATAEGEKVDADGLDHLACIAANALILLWFRHHKKPTKRYDTGSITLIMKAGSVINSGDRVSFSDVKFEKTCDLVDTVMSFDRLHKGGEYRNAPCAD